MSDTRPTAALLFAAAALGLGAAWYGIGDRDGGPVLDTGPGDDGLGEVRVITRAEAVEAQGGAAAQARFDQAEDWNGRNNEAVAALDAGDIERALALIRGCHEHDPSNVTYRRNHVEILARYARGLWEQQDRDDAIHELARALELAEGLPGDERRDDLVELMERWEREHAVEADFFTDTSLHFELSYDARHDDLRDGYQEVLDLCEAVYADLRDVFLADPVFDKGKRYRVTLYRRATFEEVTGLHAWAGGAFDGTVRLPVGDLWTELRGMDKLLRHELVHAFVEHVGGRDVPGWYNEGLAQHLSGEGALALLRAPKILEPGFLPLDELSGSFASWTDREKVSRAYTQSLVLVDGIAAQYGQRLLVDLCADAREGGQDGIAAGFQLRTGFTLETLLGDLEAAMAAERERDGVK